MRRIAIIGGGIAGLSAAYELHRLARDGVQVEATLFESSSRLGGIIETVREGGFVVEAGPDGWVSAKPWASELARELGLAADLIASSDATRKTHILLNHRLVPMPDAMSMMVPSNLDTLSESPLFTPAAVAAYRAEPARAAELLASIPPHDESVADFTLRHFGPEVLTRIAAPLLSGIFGGDVHSLSVRAVMPLFVEMERRHGSLIAALQARPASTNSIPIFTSLRSGVGSLIDRLTAAIPLHSIHLNTTVTALTPPTPGKPQWNLHLSNTHIHTSQRFDAVLLATPVDAARTLLAPFDSRTGQLLPAESSSAILVAFCYPEASLVPVPPGFGFLVPPDPATPQTESSAGTTRSLLLACTFADQKFPGRVPPGGRIIRAFFGGTAAERIARCNNDEIAAITQLELARILWPANPFHTSSSAPPPTPLLTVIRRLPNSLPQYQVGHLERVAEIESRLCALPGLALLGNMFHGVGIPDIIRDARHAALNVAGTTAT